MKTDTVLAITPDGYMEVRRLKGRRLNKMRAEAFNFFWLPCLTCGQEFGGHEWDGRGVPHAPPFADEVSPMGSRGLCPACLEAGVHVAWWLVAPPECMRVWNIEDIEGPMGHLIRESLGRIGQSLQLIKEQQ